MKLKTFARSSSLAATLASTEKTSRRKGNSDRSA
jgi:hypothetical protein